MDIVEVGEFLFHFTQAQIMFIYLVHLTVFIYIGLFKLVQRKIWPAITYPFRQARI